jgi:hypothetical protein
LVEADGRLLGALGLFDTPRPEAASILAQLRARGVLRTLLLSGDNAPLEAPVTVLASGSRLIGGSLTTKLTRAEVEAIVLDGFLFWLIAAAQIGASSTHRSPHQRCGSTAAGRRAEGLGVRRQAQARACAHCMAASAPPCSCSRDGVYEARRRRR